MTVVASFSVNGYPAMFGDLLISGTENNNDSLNLPTIGSIENIFPVGSGFVPTNLHQKIHVINRYLVIAWAGSQLAAKHVINEITSNTDSEKIYSKQELEGFFNSLDYWANDNLSIVGFSYDGTGLYTFGFNCDGFNSSIFGEVRISGSGTADLKSLMDNYSENVFFKPKKDINVLEEAVSTSLLFSTHLTGVEITSGNNLFSYYGGGYEILSLVKGEFKKNQETTYLVWTLSISDNGGYELALPNIIIKHSYVNDFLVIRRVILDDSLNDSNVLSVMDEEVFIVEPLNKKFTTEDADNYKIPKLHSMFTCSYIIIQTLEGETEVLNLVNFTGGEKYPFSLEVKNGISFVVVGQEFVQTIISEIRAKKSSDVTQA